MKKIVSCALLIVFVLASCLLTGCGEQKNESVDVATAPGSHEITTKNITSTYLTQYVRSVGRDREYIAKVDNGSSSAYGYKSIGFSVNIVPKYIYEAKFENTKLILGVTCAYSNYTSSLSLSQTLCDTVYIVLDINEAGYIANAKLGKVLVDEHGRPLKTKNGDDQVVVDENAVNGENDLGTLTLDTENKIVYFIFKDTYDENNLFCPLAISPKVTAASTIYGEGTVTYLPRETGNK